jgi:hypothetical protein
MVVFRTPTFGGGKVPQRKKRLFILNGDTSNNMQVVCLNSAYFSRRVPEDCKSVQCRFNAKIYVEHVPRSDKI